MNNTGDTVRLVGSIFIVDPLFGSARKLSHRLRKECEPQEELSELSPLPISIPPEAPAAAPRAILTEPSQTWQLVCSGERINLMHRPENAEDGESGIQASRFWELCSTIFTSLQGGLELEIGRIAGVTHRRLNLANNASDQLSRLFFRDDLPDFFVENQHSAEWHVNNRIPWECGQKECPLNRITRVKAVRLSEEPDNDKVILIETDINTIPELSDIRFQQRHVAAFFGQMKLMNSEIMEALNDINLFA